MKHKLLPLALALALCFGLTVPALAAEGKISRLPIDERPEAPEGKNFSQYITGKLLTKEELTLNGTPFYEYTYSQAKALLPFKESSAPSPNKPKEGEQEQYMTWKHNPTAASSVTHYVGSDGLARLEYSCCDIWNTEKFTVIDIGVRGIKTGDSLESVLQALGVSAEGAPIIAAEMIDNHTNFELQGNAKYGWTEGSSYDHNVGNVNSKPVCLDAPRIIWRGPDGIQIEMDFFLGRLGDVSMGDTTKIPGSPAPTDPEGPVNPDPAAPSFTDVTGSAWYADAVAWAVNEGITNGTSDTTFSPGQNCTRVQILTFLWRAAGEPESDAKLPIDITGKNIAYAESALRWAAALGLIDGSFDAGAMCTRADAVNYIWRVFDRPGAEPARFTDVDEGASYAAAVNWAVEKGVTNGKTATTFAPDEVCTRGHIVTFLHRAYVEEAP